MNTKITPNTKHLNSVFTCVALSMLFTTAQAQDVFEFPQEYLEIIPSTDEATGNLGTSTTNYVLDNVPLSNSPWTKYTDDPDTPSLDESTANNEADVAFALINHNHSQVSRSFELRIGAGGQIYSLKNSRFGEALPPQRGTTGVDTKLPPWIDEVIQFNQIPLNDIHTSAGHPTLHQAGMYLHDFMADKNGVATPFYSPALLSGTTGDSFVTMNWVQLAHQDFTTQSNSNTATSLVYSKYRVFHPGVIEVTNYAYNFGDRTYDFITTPWGGIRRTTFPDIMIGDVTSDDSVDGTYLQPDEDNKIIRWSNNRQNVEDTGGWVLFSNGQADNSPALGFVFGNEDTSNLVNGVKDFMKVGYLGGNTYMSYPSTDETAWRNYTPFQVVRRPRIEGGQYALSRYYMIIGSPQLAKALIKNLKLLEKTKFEVLDTSPVEAGEALYTWRRTSDNTMPVLNGPGSLVAHVRAKPHPGFKPVFVIKDVSGGPNDGKIYCTYDPYKLCTTVSNGETIRTPYDKTTEYIGLLGYANTSVYPTLD